MSAQARRDFFAECVRDLQAQMPQQGTKFLVQLITNSCDSGIGETTELITGFVDREENLPIRMAPYRNVKAIWTSLADDRS